MSNPEEPEYRQFDGVCRRCGREFIYYNSIKRHPDYLECDECEAVKIVEALQKPLESAVKGWG